MLRHAAVSDIASIQRVRRSVRENRLVSTVISDEHVREAIEKTGRGWVIESEGEVVAFAIGNPASGNVWALFVHPNHERRGTDGSFTTQWFAGCGLRGLVACGSLLSRERERRRFTKPRGGNSWVQRIAESCGMSASQRPNNRLQRTVIPNFSVQPEALTNL